MKLQINTDDKTITIEENINLGELYEALFEMFPKFAWKEYTLIPVKAIEHWTNPVTYPVRPWNELPWITPGTAPLYPLTNPGTGSPAYPSAPWVVTCGDGMIANANGFSVSAGSGMITTTKLNNAHVTYTSSVYNVIINNDEGK